MIRSFAAWGPRSRSNRARNRQKRWHCLHVCTCEVLGGALFHWGYRLALCSTLNRHGQEFTVAEGVLEHGVEPRVENHLVVSAVEGAQEHIVGGGEGAVIWGCQAAGRGYRRHRGVRSRHIDNTHLSVKCRARCRRRKERGTGLPATCACSAGRTSETMSSPPLFCTGALICGPGEVEGDAADRHDNILALIVAVGWSAFCTSSTSMLKRLFSISSRPFFLPAARSATQV